MECCEIVTRQLLNKINLCKLHSSHSLTSFKRVVRIGEMLVASCRSVFLYTLLEGKKQA